MRDGTGRPDVIHRKKFADGRETPQEMYRRVLGLRCRCGQPGVVTIQTFAEYDDALRRIPAVVTDLMVRAAVSDAPITFTGVGGVRFIRLGELTACMHHRVEAERAAAHPPRGYPECWVVVDRGPDQHGPIVQVA